MQNAIVPAPIKSSIIPVESEVKVPKLNPEQQEAFARKAALSAESLGADYTESLERYRALASQGMQQVIRDDISNMEFMARQSKISSSIKAALQEGASDVMAREMENMALQRAEEAALEKQHQLALQNSMPEEWQSLAGANADLFESASRADYFRSLVNAEVSKLGREEEAEGWVEEIPDFLKFATGLPNLVDNYNFSEGTRADQINRVKKTLQFIKEQPPEQWAPLLSQLTQEIRDSRFLVDNPYEVMDIYSVALGTERDLDTDTIFSGMDALFVLAEVKAVSELGKRGFKLANSVIKDVDEDVLSAKTIAGDEAIAEDIINDTKKLVRDPDEAVEQVNIFKAPNSAYSTGVSPHIKKKLAAQESKIKEAIDNFTAPEMLSEVLARETKIFEQEFAGRSVISSTVDDKTGNLVFTYGTTRATPFKTEKAAQESIANKGLENAEVISSPHGYYVQVKTNSPDARVGFNEIGPIARRIQNVSDVVKALLPVAQQAEGAANQVNQAVQGMINELAKYQGKKGAALNKVIEKGIKDKVWYNGTEFKTWFRELNNRAPTTGEELAYQTYRQLNDYADVLRVTPKLKDISARGDLVYTMQGSGLGGDYKVIGKEIKTDSILAKETNREAVVLMEGDKIVPYYKGEMDEGSLEYLQNFRLLEINSMQAEDLLHAGKVDFPVKYIAVPRTVNGRSATHADVSNYVAGGRTANASPFFVKIAMVADGKAGKYRLSDHTVAAASSKQQAQENAIKFQKLIDLMKRNKDDLTKVTDEQIEALGIKAVPMSTVKQADEFMQSRQLYTRAIKVEGVGNRGVVNLGKVGDTDLSAGITVDNAMLNPTYQSLFGKRTEGVPHVDGEKADMLDPLEAVVDSFNTATNYATSAAFRERSLNYMRETFGKYLDTESTNAYALLTANIKRTELNDPDKAKLVSSIKAHQTFLSNMLAQPTEFEMAWANWTDNAMNAVFDTYDKYKGKFFGRGSIEPSRESLTKRQNVINVFGQDPVTKVRSLTFHSTLGLFSLPSFVMQMINVVNITALSPKYGSTAAMQALPLRMALLAESDEATKIIASKYKVAGFKSAEEFTDYVKEFRNLGVGYIGNNHVLISGLNGAQLSGTKTSRALEFGRVFFDQGELLNRLTAYGAARKKWDLEVGKGKAASSPEGRAWIQSETHRLTLGMSRSDLQLGLRNNLASIPTQFLSYPMRLTSAMAPQILGGSKSFTAAEKRRLVAMNLVMFGGAGVPLADVVADYIIQSNPSMDADTAKFISNGLIDGALHAMSDGQLDTNFSARAGTGEFLTQIIRDVQADKTFLEIIGGAAGSKSFGLLSSADEFVGLMGAMTNPSLEGITDATVDLIVENISSLKTYDRALTAYTEGVIYTKYGSQLAKVTKKEAIGIALGLPPQAYENIGAAIRQKKQRDDLIKNEIKLLDRLYKKYYSADTEQEKMEYIKAINYHMWKLDTQGLGLDVAQQYLRNIGLDDMESHFKRRQQELKLRTPEGADKYHSEQFVKEEQ